MGRFLLLLILVVLFIQGITSTSVNVNEGKLSNVTQLVALAAIAGQSDGDALLALLNGTDEHWHPMAFWRFMILGAPPNKESLNLTKENELLRNVSKMEGLSATQKSAVALYQSTEDVKEVGKVDIKAWSLAYSCLSDTTDTSQCDALAPVFVLYSQSNKSNPEYVSLYRGFFTGSQSTYFASVVSADLANLQYYSDSKEGMAFQMPDYYSQLQQCKLSSFEAARSVVAASYGLPGFVCYNASSLTNVKGNRVLSNEHALDNKTTYGDSVEWPKVPIEDCSTAPFLYGYFDSSVDYNIMACAMDSNSSSYTCVTIALKNVGIRITGCNVSKTIDAMYYKVMMNSSSTDCRVSNKVIKDLSGYIPVNSRWETSDGNDKTEFELGQPTGDFCYMPIATTQASEPISCSDTNSQTSHRCDPKYFSEDLLEATLRDTAENFLSGHVSQANIKKGPYGSRLDAAALAVATFMGLVGMIVPLTKAELKLVKRCREKMNCSDGTGQKAIVVCLCVLNVGIGIAAYGAIIAAMVSQYEKHERFHTWAISATSETVNSYGTKLLFLTFVEGSSRYFSRLIWGFYVAACVLALSITLVVTFCLSYPKPITTFCLSCTKPIETPQEK